MFSFYKFHYLLFIFNSLKFLINICLSKSLLTASSLIFILKFLFSVIKKLKRWSVTFSVKLPIVQIKSGKFIKILSIRKSFSCCGILVGPNI